MAYVQSQGLALKAPHSTSSGVQSGQTNYTIPSSGTSWWGYNSSGPNYYHTTGVHGGVDNAGFDIPTGVRKITIHISGIRFHGTSAHPSKHFLLKFITGSGTNTAHESGGSYEGWLGNDDKDDTTVPYPTGFGFGNGGATASGLGGEGIPLYHYGYGFLNYYWIEIDRVSVRTNSSGDNDATSSALPQHFDNTSTARYSFKYQGFWTNQFTSVQDTGSRFSCMGYCPAMSGGHIRGFRIEGGITEDTRFEVENLAFNWEF